MKTTVGGHSNMLACVDSFCKSDMKVFWCVPYEGACRKLCVVLNQEVENLVAISTTSR